MTEEQLLGRIEVNPNIVAGKPVIKGTRLQVALVLRLLAGGATIDDLLADYNWIEVEDIRACLLFAGKALEDITFMPLIMESSDAVSHR